MHIWGWQYVSIFSFNKGHCNYLNIYFSEAKHLKHFATCDLPPLFSLSVQNNLKLEWPGQNEFVWVFSPAVTCLHYRLMKFYYQMHVIFPFSNLLSVMLRYSQIQEFPCKSGAPGIIVDAAIVLLTPREEFLTSLSSYRDQGKRSGPCKAQHAGLGQPLGPCCTRQGLGTF